MEISFSESARVGHQTCVEYSPRMSTADLKSCAWFQIDQRLEAAFDKCQSWQQQNSRSPKISHAYRKIWIFRASPQVTLAPRGNQSHRKSSHAWEPPRMWNSFPDCGWSRSVWEQVLPNIGNRGRKQQDERQRSVVYPRRYYPGGSSQGKQSY